MVYNEKKVELLRQRYPEGTRICLDQMNDDPFPVESGTFGCIHQERKQLDGATATVSQNTTLKQELIKNV